MKIEDGGLDLDELREQAIRWSDWLERGNQSAEKSAAFQAWVSSPRNERALVKYSELLSMTREFPRQRVARLYARRALLPGSRLAVVAESLLSKPMFKRYVAPIVADLQYEHAKALAAGRVWRARWIVIHGHLLVITGWIYAFVSGKLTELLRRGR